MGARAGNDLRDRIQRIANAEPVVVGKAQVAVVAVRVLPRNREHGEAVIDEVLRERVARREVEHVVLHDPRRHHQHRLGVRRLRRRCVLDQLDQAVAQHDAAGRDCDVDAGRDALGADRRQVGRVAPQVFEHIGRAAQQVHAAFFERAPQHRGVGEHAVRRREHVEPLTRREADHLLVMSRDAGHTGGGVLPPLLAQKEELREHGKRPLTPLRVVEALVLRQRLDEPWVGAASHADLHRAQRLLEGQLREVPLLGRRQREVGPPVHERAERGRRRERRRRRTEQRRQRALELLVMRQGVRPWRALTQPQAAAALARAGRQRGCGPCRDAVGALR